MTAEREIAGFALPFAAGVLSAGIFSYPEAAVPGVCACAGLTFVMSFIMNGHFLETGTKIQVTAIAAAAFFCGMVTCLGSLCMEISSSQGSGLIERTAIGFGMKMRETIDSIPFEEDETGAVLKALITADRSSLSKETTEVFRKSGAAHILALSGMHLGIIYLIISGCLSFLGNNHIAIRVRSALTILTCGFYTLATGAGESITRAFLFIVLNEGAKLAHRKPGMKVILMSALIIQLAADPMSLHSAGFQLSYAAVAGIAFIHPHLKEIWPEVSYRKGILRRIWENASISISCQLSTGPLAWHLFRSFPPYFLLTNLTAIPLTSLTIPVALCTMTLYAIGMCPQILVDITEKCVSLLTGALNIISSM